MKRIKKIIGRSKLEKRIIEDLMNNNQQFQYEGTKIHYNIVDRIYTPDIVLPNGLVVEIKGYFRKEDQVKMRAVKESHPELDIRFIFERLDSPLEGAQKRKDGTKMTCEEYAIKYEFKYAEGTIPKAWINE